MGAVLIGYFGAVQEPPHTLDELLALYARPPFVAFSTIFVLLFLGVLLLAHLAEWQLHVRLFRPYHPPTRKHSRSLSASGKGKRSNGSSGGGARGRPTRRWSAPTLAPVVEVSESSSGIATPVLAIADEANRRGLPVERVLLNRSSANSRSPKSYGTIAKTIDPVAPSVPQQQRDASPVAQDKSTSAAALLAAKYDPVVRRTCLGLSVAYGAASGTLSGACLLLAKSGVELLVLTIAGHNQFARWQSWALVGIMLVAAVLQLWYLNKALRLADPTLVCPLAFCFYNTSSIALGLVYFNQLGALSATSLLLVVLGTAILLTGVWIVSMHGEEQPSATDGAEAMQSPTEREALLTSNGAGITGPHLPPVSSPTQQANGSDSSPSPSTSPLTSPPASPTSSRLLSPLSPIGKSRRRRSRSGSGSGSFIGGLGLHVPGLPPADPTPFDVVSSPVSMEPAPPLDSSPSSSSTSDLESGAQVSSKPMARSQSEAAALGKAHDHAAHPPSSSALRRTRDMYKAVLERGLSIGISPSSPGFHLAASFAPEDDEQADDDDGDGSGRGRRSLMGAWSNFVKRRGRSPRLRVNRRTFSEADIESRRHASEAHAAPEEQGIEEDEEVETLADEEETGEERGGSERDATPPSSSGWNMVLAVDYRALSDRLSRLKNDAGGWLGLGGEASRQGGPSSRDEEEEERRSLV